MKNNGSTLFVRSHWASLLNLFSLVALLLLAVALSTVSVHATNYTWAGGTGNWNAANWLPGNVAGPTAGSDTATGTNGQVTVNVGGGVGGLGSIILASGGTMVVGNSTYGSYGNILLTGGTLNTASGSYNAYGASALTAVTATGGTSSTISDSGGSWFNLDWDYSTFTVNSGAQLTVSAPLRGAAWGGVDDTQYRPSALIKTGAGTLTLTANNTYIGDTTVNGGTLALASGGQLSFTIGANGVNNKITSSTPPTVGVGNSGFETPAQSANGFTYSPSGASWTFPGR